MRMHQAIGVLAAIGVTAALPAWAAEEAFDACTVFTEADAQAGLGVAAAPEPINPKVKRPKVVLTCTYQGFKDSKAVAASTTFKVGRNVAAGVTRTLSDCPASRVSSNPSLSAAEPITPVADPV